MSRYYKREVAFFGKLYLRHMNLRAGCADALQHHFLAATIRHQCLGSIHCANMGKSHSSDFVMLCYDDGFLRSCDHRSIDHCLIRVISGNPVFRMHPIHGQNAPLGLIAIQLLQCVTAVGKAVFPRNAA